MRRVRLEAAAVLAVAMTVVVFTYAVVAERAARGATLPNFDTYAAFYPNVIYALRSFEEGSGLLWNRLQNCGAPFLTATMLSPFYPPHWILLFADLDAGLFVLFALNLVIGGVGTFFLCRELGVTRGAAVCGGIAFALGEKSLDLTGWAPPIAAHYAWLPACAWMGERLIKHPGVPRGIHLGAVLTLQFLSGYPQISFFTYQFLGLRVLWGTLALRRRMVPVAGFTAFAMSLPLVFGGIYALPTLERARESVRNESLSVEEIRPPAVHMTWESFRDRQTVRREAANIFATLPMALMGFALFHRRLGRESLCLLLVGILYVTLAFDNALFDFYRRLPFGSMFRLPNRFLWMVALVGPVLVAIGLDAATENDGRFRYGRLPAVCAGVLGAAVSGLLAGQMPHLSEWLQLGVLAMVGLGVLSGNSVFRRVVVGGMLVGSIWFNPSSLFGPMTSAPDLYAKQAIFAALKERMTLQDRIYQFAEHHDYSMQAKLASILGFASITDYEPQTSRRYAEITTWMIFGRPMKSLNEFYVRLSQIARNRPLLNLLAARFIVADQSTQVLVRWPREDSFDLLWQKGAIGVYENRQALPRAYFVARAAIVEDAGRLLERLASDEHDPRRIVLLEAAPSDGFLGTDDAGAGQVAIQADRSETLSMQVAAPAEGFLVLTDQYAPGWSATVNGEPHPILRANYAFRAVRVPRGESRVELEYFPRSLAIGAALSFLSVSAAALYLVVQRRRRRNVALNAAIAQE